MSITSSIGTSIGAHMAHGRLREAALPVVIAAVAIAGLGVTPSAAPTIAPDLAPVISYAPQCLGLARVAIDNGFSFKPSAPHVLAASCAAP